MAKKEIDEMNDDQNSAPPDPWAVMNRVAMAIESLAKRNTEAPGDSQVEGLLKILGPALERLAESNIAGAKLITEEQRRSHRPSNEFVHARSVFNRRGVLLSKGDAANLTTKSGELAPLKSPLKCTMLLPWLAEWESLTREEVDLLNLLQPGDYVIRRIDNSRIRLTVSIEYRVDGVTPSRLLMNHETAFNNDNKNLVPPLADFLRQILRQHDIDTKQAAAAVMTDEEEEALIEASEMTVSA